MKKDFLVALIAILFLFQSCVSPGQDVYKFIPKESRLTKDVLIQSEQIIKNKSDLLLMYNISTNEAEYYDPHLLFYDSSLKLYSASYFASELVDSLKSDTIIGALNEDRIRRAGHYRNDLPKRYTLNLYKKDGGSGQVSNKIIDNIEVDSNSFSVTLYVRKSEKTVGGFSGSEKVDSLFLKDYLIRDTIRCSLNTLHFESKKGIIATRFIDSNGYLMWDEMLVVRKSVLETFYDDLYNHLEAIGMR
jgi:hypothetical protein